MTNAVNLGNGAPVRRRIQTQNVAASTEDSSAEQSGESSDEQSSEQSNEQSASSEETAATAAPAEAPRRRGRPKGSVNKAKAETAQRPVSETKVRAPRKAKVAPVVDTKALGELFIAAKAANVSVDAYATRMRGMLAAYDALNS